VHLSARWNAAFDSEIQLTIAQDEKVSDRQQDGGSVIFALFDADRQEIFRVIYNGGAYDGNGMRPQGIISACARTSIPTVIRPNAAEISQAAVYRTDCSVIHTI